jgi:hypothetical protein
MEMADRSSMSGGRAKPLDSLTVFPIADNVVKGWFTVPRPDGVDVLGTAVSGRPYAFVIVDVRQPKGEIEGAVNWTSQFVAALRGRTGIEFFVKENDNFQPSILVVGRRLLPALRRKAHSAGCVVYDLDLPSNASFEEPGQIVRHLVSLDEATSVPSAVWTKDPKANPAQYYEAVPDMSADDLREYLRFLNQDVT